MKDAIQLSKRGLIVMPVHGLKWVKEELACTCGKPDCSNVAKHPIFFRWQQIGRESPATIEAWYRTYKDANLAVITGKESGIVVLDVDTKNNGYESLKAAEEQYEELPETPTVITGSGGRHFYFRHPGGRVGNRAKMFGGGVDVRGDGGFVVAPHSKHMKGQYEWEVSPEDCPFADLPQWLYREIQKPQANMATAAQVTGEVMMSEGGRDNWLTSMAGTLRRRGAGVDAIARCLWVLSKYHCDPPMGQDDVMRIAKSVCRYPAGNTH